MQHRRCHAPPGYTPIKASECLTDYLSLCMSACQSLSLSLLLSLSLPLSVCPSVCPLHSVVCVPSPRFVCTVNQYACKSAPSGPLATGNGQRAMAISHAQHRCCCCSVAARFTIICHQPRLSSRQLTLACGISFVVYYGMAYKCGLHVALDCIASNHPARLVSLCLTVRLSAWLPVSIIHAKPSVHSALNGEIKIVYPRHLCRAYLLSNAPSNSYNELLLGAN